MLEFVGDLIDAEALKTAAALGSAANDLKSQNDEIIKNIVAGKDKRKLVVCGPCSADDPRAVKEYCFRLRDAADKVSDKLFVVPRLYIAKARTRGNSYQGLLLDEKAGKSLSENVIICRNMFVEIIEQTGFPIADELLFAEQKDFFSDLISYYFIGARQSDSPFFKGVASGLDVAVGVKNNLSGSLELLLFSLQAIGMKRRFFAGGREVITGGALCHGVLRGFNDYKNEMHANNGNEFISRFKATAEWLGLNSFVMVDCNHANSAKDFRLQINNALEAAANPLCGGVMLESYLKEGKSDSEFGCSKTDACLGWEDTESLLMQMHRSIRI